MSFVRSKQEFEELRHTREAIAMTEVARILLDPNLLNIAIQECGLLSSHRESENWLDFVVNDYDENKDLVRDQKKRLYSYINNILQQKAGTFGLQNDTDIAKDNKQIEGLLLYAVCFKVEGDFDMKDQPEYLTLASLQCEDGSENEMRKEAKLATIKSASQVLSAGKGLDGKAETLIILLQQLIRYHQDKNPQQQIPVNIKLEIVKDINAMLSEVKSLKEAKVYQFLFGGSVKSAIEMKEQKIKFLHQLLGAENLGVAQLVAMETLKYNRNILEGRTLERATDVMRTPVTKSVEMTMFEGPKKSPLPFESDGENFSPPANKKP